MGNSNLSKIRLTEAKHNLQKLQAEGYNLITTELSVQAALKKKQEEILALKKRIQELDTLTENSEMDALSLNSEKEEE